MEKHLKILSWLHIVYGALGVLVAIFFLVIFAGSGLLSGEMEGLVIGSGVGLLAGSFLFFLSVPGIIGGIYLMRRQRWARVLVLIVGILNLLSLPVGTLLGIYTLWVLLGQQGEQLFQPDEPPVQAA